jgi:hypothetical protein
VIRADPESLGTAQRVGPASGTPTTLGSDLMVGEILLDVQGVELRDHRWREPTRSCKEPLPPRELRNPVG